MKCKKCKSEISEFDIFCKNCGTPTDLLSKGLSAKENKKKTSKELAPIRSSYYSLSMFLTLTVIFPIIIGIFLSKNNHILISSTLIIFLPFLLILITREKGFYQKKSFTIKEYFGLLPNYPKFILFVFYNILYFYVLTLICTAKPILNYAYDPILNLVWLVMFFYWLAIIIPAPGLIAHKNYSPFKAIVEAYKKGKETRWQQFFTFIYIFLDILFGIVTLGFGFMIAIPHITLLLDNYYYRMEKYHLFD